MIMMLCETMDDLTDTMKKKPGCHVVLIYFLEIMYEGWRME